MSSKLRAYALLFRFHQYIKNLFIFAPLFFSFSFTTEAVLQAAAAFILFSLIASSVYILNDYLDVNEDRLHPVKCRRPIASGDVSPREARMLGLTLALPSLTAALLLNTHFFVILLIYLAINIAYSFKLKHVSVLDIFLIAAGFVLRVFAGSVVIGVATTHWIILMTFLLALFLALAKRRDDVLLSQQGKETRKNIDGYNLEFINAAMVLMGGVIIVSYILYTVSPEVMARIGSQHLYITAFFVILGILRYMQITFVEEESGSPTKVVLRDRFIQLTLLAWAGTFLVIATL